MKVKRISGCSICGDSTSNGRFCKNCQDKVENKTQEAKEEKVSFLEVLEQELKMREV